MKRITFRSLSLAAAFAAMIGCQSAPKFAWWKQDKPAETSAVASNTKTPALPSAQSTPQAVAVAGTTPPAANIAAMPAAGATGTLLTARGAAASPPPLSIPVTSPTAVASTAPPIYPVENSLADKLVSTPNSKTAPMPGATPGATSLAAAPSAPPMATAGPYDPSAYKPSASAAATDVVSSTLDADRYATSSGSVPGPPPASSQTVVSPAAAPSQTLASDPGDRYGSRRMSTTPAAMPGQTALTDPAALAADRYANPSIPSLAGATSQPATTTAASPAIKLTSAVGQYRPGGTSSYTATSATASPVEIASRPSPATTDSAPAAGTGSQPWSPDSTPTSPTSRPY